MDRTGKSRCLLQIFLLLSLGCLEKFGTVRSVFASSDIWGLGSLNADDNERFGNVGRKKAPVNRNGLYLDGSDGTYVKLKNYDIGSLKDPSTSDLTLGLFLKFNYQDNVKNDIFFGNKVDNGKYKGVNIYHDYTDKWFKVAVNGTDNYCVFRLYVPLMVWFHLGFIWDKSGDLDVYVDGEQRPIKKDCEESPGNFKTSDQFFLGKAKYSFAIAYYRNLKIWYSKQDPSKLVEQWEEAIDNGQDTEIILGIVFTDLPFDSGEVGRWTTDLTAELESLYIDDTDSFKEVTSVQVSDSGGNTSASLTIKFYYTTWEGILKLQIAIETGSLLGSPAFIESCTGDDDFFCDVPDTPNQPVSHHNKIVINIDTSSYPSMENLNEGHIYCFGIVYKNLDDPNGQWQRSCSRKNVPPMGLHTGPLPSHTSFSVRVMAEAFKASGLLSEPQTVKTNEWYPSVAPELVGATALNSTAVFVEWRHTIPEAAYNGILIGYTIYWSEGYYGISDPLNSWGTEDVGLEATTYTIQGLHENWEYDIWVAGRTSKGAATWAEETITTHEDSPSAPPSSVTLHMINETALNGRWNEVPFIDQNGIILGYRLYLEDPDDLLIWNDTVPPDVQTYDFTGLLIFQNYSLQVLAFTVKGDGPMNSKVYGVTDESVPITSPVNLTADPASSTTIHVTWDFINNPRHVLGHLVGFFLYLEEATAYDNFTGSSYSTFFTGDVRSYDAWGLNVYRLYNISIAARTQKGAGPKSAEYVIVRTRAEVPGAPPQGLTAYNTSASSLHVYWGEVPRDKRYGIIQGYIVSFFELTSSDPLYLGNQTNNVSLPQANFTGLKTYTKYRILVSAINQRGKGELGQVEVYTDEGSPSSPPSNFTAYNISSTMLRADWNPVPTCCQLGVIQGYHVTLTDPVNSSVVIAKTVSELFVNFTDLEKFHVYSMSIDAFTSKGAGPAVSASASTDQDVPEAPPQNVHGYNISQTEIQLFWDPVPDDKVPGFITGYQVDYRRVGSKYYYRSRVFNSSTFEAVLDKLYPFVYYSITVTGFTIKGLGIASPTIVVQTEEEAPRVAPANFQGANSSSTSIVLSWDPIPAGQVAGILQSFRISYREIDTKDNTIHNVTVPVANLSLEITDLRKFTNFSLEVQGTTKFPGLPTEPIIVTTDEDVPSLPPQDIKLQNSSSTSISVQWNPIPDDFVHGILLGFRIFYRAASRDNSVVFRLRARREVEEHSTNYTNVTLDPDALSFELTSLNRFTNYTIVLLGFTAKGDGNISQHFLISTDQDIPSMPPSDFVPISRSGDFKMTVTWEPVPDGFVHGVLLGYRIFYTKIKETRRTVSTQTQVITLDPYEHSATIFLLNNFAVYTMEITAFTIKGDGVRSELKDASTCNCPRLFKTTYYTFPPYIKHENGKVGGIIPRILEDAVNYCCSDCMENGTSASTIDFEFDGKGNAAKKSGVKQLISSIESDTDFSVPVNGYEGQTHYSLYRYVKLAESPGVAFITFLDPGDKSQAITNVFVQTWPILVLFLAMTFAAGMIMWVLETRGNKEEFPRSFVKGTSEGIWWAYVSATTVGYGDRCPRGAVSRVFAIAWTLCGLVIISILTGKIATVLTEFGFNGPYITLYGTKVAAIANNSDFRLGVRKNAKVNTVRNYTTYEEISQALATREVQGALVDLYVLSNHKHLFEDPRFRIVRVYDYKTSYGVVLAGHSMKLEHCFTEHIKVQSESVYGTIEEHTKILKEPEESPAEQQSTDMFDMTSPLFIVWTAVILALLLLGWVIGVIFEKLRKKNKALKQSKDIRKEVDPIVQDFLVRTKKEVTTIARRHRQERRQVCQVKSSTSGFGKQITSATNKFYEVADLRWMKRHWSRQNTTKSARSLGKHDSPNPGVWPFMGIGTKEGHHEPAGSIPRVSRHTTPLPTPLPLKKGQGGRSSHEATVPFTLEPKIRVIDKTQF